MSRALERQGVAVEISKGAEDRTRLGESAALTVGGIAALLVGACCVGPLVFVSIGLGGAWLANLTSLDPYRPIFILIALVALGFAWRRIYRPVTACEPGAACAIPAVRQVYKTGFWLVSVLLVAMFSFPYLAPLFY